MDTPETDEALLVAWYAGDGLACQEFYRRHAPRLAAFFRRRGVPTDCVDDVLQLAFLKIHRELDRFDPNQPALPWIFVIARNVCFDWLRAHVRQTARTASDSALDHAQAPVAREADADLEQALGELTPQQRELVTLRVEEGLSFREISARSGRTEVSLRKQFQRIVSSLRNAFASKEEANK